MTNQDRLLAYLRHYANKDLHGVAAMLADDVTLRDWNLSVSGKQAVLAETEKNFESASRIEIETLHLYESNGAVAGELRIVIDGSIELFVVDVISFDSAGMIQSIRAYLGKGDH